MNRADFEKQFLAYHEGSLSEQETKSLRHALKNDPELARSFSDYKAIVLTEEQLSKEIVSAGPGFERDVMSRLEFIEEGVLKRFFKSLTCPGGQFGAAVVACSLAVVMLKLAIDNRDHFEYLSPIYNLTDAGNSFRVEGAYEGESVESHDYSALQAPEKVTSAFPPSSVAGKEAAEDRSLSYPDFRERRRSFHIDSFAGERDKAGRGDPALGAQSSTESGPRRSESTDYMVGPALPDPAPLRSTVPVGRSSDYSGRLDLMPRTPRSEMYPNHGENTRVRTSAEAISTFSIDVDTASYTNARRWLSQGILPPPDSVRIEEFLNYFDYDYAKLSEGPFALHYEVGPSPLENERYLLKLGITANDLAAPAEKGWNLVFLVDVSGSMAEMDRLPLVQNALRILVNQMREQDRVAIVTYAGNVRLALDSTSGRERARILSVIDQLRAGGGTYGSGGIKEAYRIAKENFIDGSVNRVILMTDGDFNVGITSFDDLLRLVEEKRKSGVTLTTLGFGRGNLKDALMEQLANRGNGNYFYIDSLREARKVLETDLVANMKVVASDVKLQVEFNPAHVIEYRLIGYENRKLSNEDFRNDRVDAGEIGSGHAVTALYELVLTDTPLADRLRTEYRYQEKENPEPRLKEGLEGELGFVKIRYKTPGKGAFQEHSFPLRRDSVKDEALASQDFLFAAAVSYFAHKLRQSQFAGDYSYRAIAELAAKGKGQDPYGFRQEFIELVRNAELGPAETVRHNTMPPCVNGRVVVSGEEHYAGCDGTLIKIR